VADNLKAAAFAAGLSAQDQKKIDDLSQTLKIHRELSNLPSDVAVTVYNSKPIEQQQQLVNLNGNEDPTIKPKRGFLGSAWHYTGGMAGAGIGKVFAGVQELSDLTTRGFRASQIALEEGIANPVDAWKMANDKGDKVFSTGRLNKARAQFGNAAVNVATRIASGESIDQIAKDATPEEMKYLRLAQKTQGKEFGLTNDIVKGQQDLFNDTLAAVEAAKYSPGRFIANIVDAVTPGDLYKSGFFYKGISGAVDAAWRVFADPTLVVGKVKRLVDVKKYAVDVLLGDAAKGGKKLDEYFANPNAVKFWDEYGAQLKALDDAEKAGETVKVLAATNQLKTLAPEFGPAVVRDFLKAGELPVTDALTAKAYFQNADQLTEMMKGSAGRKRIIMPRLDPLRQARIATVTTANKIFNLDRIGSKFVDDMFFGVAATNDGITKALIDGQEQIVSQVAANAPSKDVARYSMGMIQRRIDNAKAKLTPIPIFKNDLFDVTAKGSEEEIFRLSRLVLPQRESKLIKEAFRSTEDIGKRKEIFYGVWKTIAEIRGMNVVQGGDNVVRQATGKNGARYAAGFGIDNPSLLPNGESIGLIASDLSNFVTAPGLDDIDRLASRTALAQRMLGVGNSKFVDNMTSAWSFLTLAGPRYAIRNATEDLMVHLAIGESPWGLVQGRLASTRIRTAKGVVGELSDYKSLGKAGENPLGSVLRFFNKQDAENYAAEFAKTNGSLKAARVITARALNEGKLNSFFGRVGVSKLNQEERDLLAEQILYGDLDNALMDVVEGGKNAFAGTDYATRTLNFTREHGVRSTELKINYPSGYRKKKGKAGFSQMEPLADEASKVAWLMRIAYYSNDELGSIAVANLDNPEVAIAKITEWLSNPENAKVAKAFRWGENGVTQQQHAEKIVASAKQLFSNKNDDINFDLLNKVRTLEDGEWKVTGRLSLDELPTNYDDAPKYIVGPSLIQVSDSDNYTASLIEKGWNWLGEANARMSREPMVLAEMIKIRKQFKSTGFEDAFIKAHLKNVDMTDPKKVEKATDFAKKKLAEIVEDRSRLQILQYVDNPLVRSQMAFSVRNFARFYRAQEDFYRRMARVVRYNPEAIAKASLTYEGVTHSGWIQQDDQGESYFVYPGVEAVYSAVRGALTGLGIPAEFKTPFPVNFGANVKMLTPSLNPDSMLPTLAGPLASVSMSTVSNLVDIFKPGAADTITRLTMGKYAVGQSTISAFLPAHLNRLYAAMDRDERDSQYASAWRKSVAYLEASGHGIPKRYNPDGTLIPPSAGELEEYRLKVKNTTIGILGTRFVFGFFAPASPSVQLKSDINDWVQNSGRSSFKQVWNNLLNQYPGDYDKAMAKWVELYPDQIPFTVPEGERSTVGYFRYAEESGQFVDSNQDLFKKYPEGAAFLIPHKAGFSWDAYKTMKDMGLVGNKRVDDYLREVQTASDLQTYYQRKNEYERSLESAGIDYERQVLRTEFNNWKDKFFAGRPLVQEELAQGSQKAIDRLNALDDLTNMLKDPNVNLKPKTQAALKAMVDLYNNYKKQKDEYDQIGIDPYLAQALEDETVIKMAQLSEYNENTKAAYDVLFGRLLGA
jgi:hypothetical protein